MRLSSAFFVLAGVAALFTLLFAFWSSTAVAGLPSTGTTNNIFIDGGVVPKLGAWFDESPFRARFEHKGRFSTYVTAVPTFVILAENPALRGLAAALSTA